MGVDFSGMGTFLIGVSAMIGVLIKVLLALRELKAEVKDVHEATNGLSQKLQDMAEDRGWQAGHAAAEDEAAGR